MGWFLYTPPGMSEADARIHAGAKIGYAIGSVLHLAVAVIFLILGQQLLAWYNFASVILSLACFALHLAGLRGIAFVTIMAEVTVATILATVIVGTAPLFFLMALCGPLYAPLASFVGPRVRTAVTVGMSLVFVCEAVYGIFFAPGQPLPAFWVTVFAIMNTASLCALILAVILTYHRAVDRAETALEAEYEKSEALLHNIMPAAVADRLKANPEVIADSHKPVSILFADIVGFTELSSRSTPEDLVSLLNNVFSRFDALVEAAGLEKIKTIGDAYMVVAGLPEARPDHAPAIARLALGMIGATEAVAKETGENLQIRIGINAGEVVAGVIGSRKFAYDLWGDTVNVAARMESTGVPGRIQIGADAAEMLRDRFDLEPRGEVEVKGKGAMQTWFLNGEKAAAGARPARDETRT